MEKSPQGERPFAYSLKQITQDLVLKALDDMAALPARKREVFFKNNILMKVEEAVEAVKEDAHVSEENLTKGDIINSLCSWLDREALSSLSCDVPVIVISQMIATDHPLFRDYGLKDAELRFLLDKALQAEIDKNEAEINELSGKVYYGIDTSEEYGYVGFDFYKNLIQKNKQLQQKLRARTKERL